MGASSPNFRAPPPSPVASSRRASFTANEDVLSEFLDKCGRVPNLVLPDKVFPKHTFLLNPPTFDFLRLDSLSTLLDAIATIGCFQLVNHGVPEAMVKAVMDRTIFHDETEEFVFYKDIADDHTACYSDLRELMGEAERIGKAVREKLGAGRSQKEKEEGVRVCYVNKHNIKGSKNESKEEAIRMLIRGYDERHSLCLNFCHAEFHVYSKRGWVSFSPRPDAVVVTVGDEGWSGIFKGVVGRPLLYKSDLHHNLISISFLYTSNTSHNNTDRIIITRKKKKTISLSQQLLFALFLTLLFPFLFP
ncbi:downstream target of agl15-4 [Arabidopsis lyrata subsp. lyrata]|uniref:Downstream target of agl15-4 n=1 Tax=Arabidopsis lyrata subsp. lyrata TaxID=81972 RepID=D7KXP9_ARALL|nr:downstream target of agl15-4 [Arabidopsis lyrata subsp. lyrata]